MEEQEAIQLEMHPAGGPSLPLFPLLVSFMDILTNASHVAIDSITTLNMVLSDRLHVDGNGFGLFMAHEHNAVAIVAFALVAFQEPFQFATTTLEQWVNVGPTLHSSSSIPLGPGPLYGLGPGPLYGLGPGPLYGLGPGPLYGLGPGPLYGLGPGPLYGLGPGPL